MIIYMFKGLNPYKKLQRTFFTVTECHTQAIPQQATHLSLDILLQVRSHLFPLLVSILILVAFLQWEEVPTHQPQVAATQELEATLPLEVIQPLEAILVPHHQGELQPIQEFLQVKGLEPHRGEQAFLAIHSRLPSLMVVAQHRSHCLVAFLEDRCLLSILEDKLLTQVRSIQNPFLPILFSLLFLWIITVNLPR